jgi:hypothetical protein
MRDPTENAYFCSDRRYTDRAVWLSTICGRVSRMRDPTENAYFCNERRYKGPGARPKSRASDGGRTRGALGWDAEANRLPGSGKRLGAICEEVTWPFRQVVSEGARWLAHAFFRGGRPGRRRRRELRWVSVRTQTFASERTYKGPGVWLSTMCGSRCSERRYKGPAVWLRTICARVSSMRDLTENA